MLHSEDTRINGMMEEAIDSIIIIKERSNKGIVKPLLQKYWVPLATIFLGVFPLAVLSYLTDSFWPSSIHPIPFLRSISIVLGDLIFIPTFNYYFYQLFLIKNNLLRRHKLSLLFAFLIILVMNSYIVYSVHKAWANDQYTGFMDLTIGTLSTAGWWHLCFSSFQTSLIIFFLVIWNIFSRYNKDAFIIGLSGWRVLVAYFVLGIFGFLIKTRTAFDNLPISHSLQLGWPRIAGLLIVTIILVIANKHLSKLKYNSNGSFVRNTCVNQNM